MAVTESVVRVRYAETDQMGVVYHANYLPWMEIGRTDYCRAAGHRYRDLEQEGLLLAVVEVNVRYLAPARYDDNVVIKTHVVESGSRLVRFGYELRRLEDNALLATGETRHVWLSREMKPTRLPEKYRNLFRGAGSQPAADALVRPQS